MQVNWVGQTTTNNIQTIFPLLAVEGLGRLRRQYNPVTPGLYPGAIFGSPVLPPRTIRLVWLLEASNYNDYWNSRASLLSIFNTRPDAFLDFAAVRHLSNSYSDRHRNSDGSCFNQRD
ncbi:MAG: hypothetical protein KatS3mg109_0787 [Pirellulaceae bacterium]|nr:MAG: hypothetical protein KatS3mg109_0787 [Pirellulaceae bacterium]